MMDNYSLSDIRAAVDGNGGMGGWGGGDGLIWLVVLFLFGFGGFGNGFGNRQNDAVSQEVLSNQHFNALDARITSIGNGICDSTFALNNSITGEGRAIQTQLADCCCKVQNAIREEGAATRSLIQTNQIQDLRDKVSDLQLQQSQCAQNAYLINQLRPCAVPAYLTCSPYQSYNQCGCGNI